MTLRACSCLLVYCYLFIDHSGPFLGGGLNFGGELKACKRSGLYFGSLAQLMYPIHHGFGNAQMISIFATGDIVLSHLFYLNIIH